MAKAIVPALSVMPIYRRGSMKRNASFSGAKRRNLLAEYVVLLKDSTCGYCGDAMLLQEADTRSRYRRRQELFSGWSCVDFDRFCMSRLISRGPMAPSDCCLS